MSKLTKLVVMLAAVGVLGAFSSSCVIRTSEPAVATAYYTPAYFDGYVVYYDTIGRPYIYRGGVLWYIPATHPRYHFYIGHYRTHRVHYHRWYRARGHRYRRYRRSGRVHRRSSRRTHRRSHRRGPRRRR